MARQIDLENLTDDDVPYLRQRPWLVVQAKQRGYDVPESYYDKSRTAESFLTQNALQTSGDPIGEDEEEGDGGPLGEDDDLDDEDGLQEADDEDDEEDEDDEDQDYESWNREDLSTEAGNRGLSKSGNKAELIARLREHDAQES